MLLRCRTRNSRTPWNAATPTGDWLDSGICHPKTGGFKSFPATKIRTPVLDDGPRVREHLGSIKKLPSKLAPSSIAATVIPITNRPGEPPGIAPRDSKTPQHESKHCGDWSWSLGRMPNDFTPWCLPRAQSGCALSGCVAVWRRARTRKIRAWVTRSGGTFRRALSDIKHTIHDEKVAAMKADLAQMKAEHAKARAYLLAFPSRTYVSGS